MRRSSLTPEQGRQLAEILKPRRLELHYSIRELAAANVSKASVESLERGTNLTPQPETIRGIAEALGLSTSELMLAFDWLPAGELPAIQPYLRAKYGLDDAEAASVDVYLTQLRQQHGGSDTHGPDDQEDEH